MRDDSEQVHGVVEICFAAPPQPGSRGNRSFTRKLGSSRSSNDVEHGNERWIENALTWPGIKSHTLSNDEVTVLSTDVARIVSCNPGLELDDPRAASPQS